MLSTANLNLYNKVGVYQAVTGNKARLAEYSESLKSLNVDTGGKAVQADPRLKAPGFKGST